MTEQEFYQKLFAELNKAADEDRQLSTLLEKIQSGQADFSDSAVYWQKFSELIGFVLKQNVTAPGSGLNEEVSYLILKSGHYRAYQIMSMVQKALDEKQNLHIEPQKPKFPDERARHASHALEDTTVSEEVIQRRAENAIANIANTFHDDYIQENAKLRNNAGLRTYITRTTTGKCCAWCTQIAGRYEYGRHPADVFRRHDNCDCILTYENGRQRTNVWTKKSWNSPVISLDALNFQPTRFTPEQARETERKNLQYKGLTIPGKTGIMKENSYNPKAVTESAIQNMPSIPLFQAKKTGLGAKDKLLANEAAEKNALYRQACQDLLREASKHSEIKELGIVYDENMKRKDGFDYEVGEKSHVHFSRLPNVPFHALHNHPSGETFSYSDLLIFASEPNMRSLSAVGNQNNLYVISETDKSDKFGYFSFLKQQTRKVLYTTSINGQKVEFSYNLLAEEGKKRKKKEKNLISELTENQRKELEESLIRWFDKCIEGCENYGIKYQFRKT